MAEAHSPEAIIFADFCFMYNNFTKLKSNHLVSFVFYNLKMTHYRERRMEICITVIKMKCASSPQTRSHWRF